jgi:hypothetical protein
VILDNDEIEVACDVLWSAKRDGEVDRSQDALWNRLGAVRTGDYGGSASIELRSGEIEALVRAFDRVGARIELDDDEAKLRRRLSDARSS